MKKRRIFLRKVVLLGLVMLLTSCSGSPNGDKINDPATNGNRAGPVHIITATDLHYLSPRINDKGTALQTVSSTGDGKNLLYSAEIVEAFFDQVIQEKPDGLVLTGDLTFNGEAASHEDLVKLLAKVEANGIPVAVIPGNHDIAIPDAYAFIDGKAVKTESISYARFRELYQDFGYAEARLKDPESFSYIMELSKDYWIAMIDVNTEKNTGRITKKTLSWLESALKQVRLNQKTVISATHQNVRIHNELFIGGYMVANNIDLKILLDTYHVRYNMTGHIHVQHLKLDETGLNESATGALSVSPHNFAHIHIDEQKNLKYSTETVNVSEWARQTGQTDPKLLEFAASSRDYFYNLCYQKTKLLLADCPNLTEQQLDRLLQFSSAMNIAYYAGDLCALCQELEMNPDYLLWKEKAGTSWSFEYMQSYLKNAQKNENTAEFSLVKIVK